MKAKNYTEVLQDYRWLSKRNEIITRDNNRCVNCKKKAQLQVHHRQYLIYSKTNQFVKPWSYPSGLLITLCSKCHQAGHKHFQINYKRI